MARLMPTDRWSGLTPSASRLIARYRVNSCKDLICDQNRSRTGYAKCEIPNRRQRHRLRPNATTAPHWPYCRLMKSARQATTCSPMAWSRKSPGPCPACAIFTSLPASRPLPYRARGLASRKSPPSWACNIWSKVLCAARATGCGSQHNWSTGQTGAPCGRNALTINWTTCLICRTVLPPRSQARFPPTCATQKLPAPPVARHTTGRPTSCI